MTKFVVCAVFLLSFQTVVLLTKTATNHRVVFNLQVSHKKGIDKKLLFGAAQGFNSQFLNLFGFSISVSFVWCII